MRTGMCCVLCWLFLFSSKEGFMREKLAKFNWRLRETRDVFLLLAFLLIALDVAFVKLTLYFFNRPLIGLWIGIDLVVFISATAALATDRPILDHFI